MQKLSLLALSLACGVLTAAPVLAAEAAADNGPEVPFGTKMSHEAADSPKLSFGAAADVVSSYIFRGYEVTDSGLIVQPSITATLAIPDSPVTLHACNWDSIQSYDDKGLTSDRSVLFEADAILGATIALPKNFTLDISYVGYFYPSDDVDNIHELDVAVAAPTQKIGDLTLDLGVLVAAEFAKESNDRNLTYLEFNGSVGLPKVSDDVAFSIPFAIGCSVDDYYTDASGSNEFFGYAQVGLKATGDIASVKGLSWNAGIYGVFGNNNVVLNDTAKNTSVFAKVGLAYSF